MIKGTVFDMDGLMFDTERLTYECWLRAMTESGFEMNMDIFKKTVGKRTAEDRKFYEELYGERFDYSVLREKANVYFREITDKSGVPIKKGLFELLDFLKKKNIKTAVATSTSSKSAVYMLKKAGVYDYFDAFVFGESVKNGKPHPEAFLKAAERLGLAPEDCIALEDSVNGIKSAFAAKMKAVMVPDMIEPDGETKQMLYALCKDLTEVENYVICA